MLLHNVESDGGVATEGDVASSNAADKCGSFPAVSEHPTGTARHKNFRRSIMRLSTARRTLGSNAAPKKFGFHFQFIVKIQTPYSDCSFNRRKEIGLVGRGEIGTVLGAQIFFHSRALASRFSGIFLTKFPVYEGIFQNRIIQEMPLFLSNFLDIVEF